MPRPGPRSYECVRRPWHSEMHQPIRGSVIQEIFRLVNGIHSSTTKNNKEWQEKLPIVVLKAEEIMYSKASSEKEYMDLKTLWVRINEAVDTIIRKDDWTENSELLHPCIEASLILGCTPRRTLGSKKCDNPRNYLSSATTKSEEISFVLSNCDLNIPPSLLQQDRITNLNSNSAFPSHYTSVNSNNFLSKSTDDRTQHLEQVFSVPMSDSFHNEIFPSCLKPLNFGTIIQFTDPQFIFQDSQFSIPNIPVKNNRTSVQIETRFFQDPSLEIDISNSKGIGLLDSTGEELEPYDNKFDLSLRLGLSSVPCFMRNSYSNLLDRACHD